MASSSIFLNDSAHIREKTLLELVHSLENEQEAETDENISVLLPEQSGEFGLAKKLLNFVHSLVINSPDSDFKLDECYLYVSVLLQLSPEAQFNELSLLLDDIKRSGNLRIEFALSSHDWARKLLAVIFENPLDRRVSNVMFKLVFQILSFNCTLPEMKVILDRLTTKKPNRILLSKLSTILSLRRDRIDPSDFFDFNGFSSGIHLFPTLKFPSSGYSFTLLVRFESLTDRHEKDQTYTPFLFFFETRTQNHTFEVFLQNRLIHMRIKNKQKESVICFAEYPITQREWHRLTFVHEAKSIKHPQLHLYANGKRIGSKEIVFPKIVTIYPTCFIGTNALPSSDQSLHSFNKVQPFFGQIADVIFFTVPLNEDEAVLIRSAFLSASDFENNSLFGENKERILFALTPLASYGPLCHVIHSIDKSSQLLINKSSNEMTKKGFERYAPFILNQKSLQKKDAKLSCLSFLMNPETFNAMMLQGTVATQTSSVQDSFIFAGGAKLLLPLIQQLESRSSQMNRLQLNLHNSKSIESSFGLVNIFELISVLTLNSRHLNEMFASHFFMLFGYSLERIHSSIWNNALIDLLEKIGRNIISQNHSDLFVEYVSEIFLNGKIWTHTSFLNQVALFSVLKKYFADYSQTFSSSSFITQILALIRRFYWVISESGISYLSLWKNNQDHLSFDEIQKIHNVLFSLISILLNVSSLSYDFFDLVFYILNCTDAFQCFVAIKFLYNALQKDVKSFLPLENIYGCAVWFQLLDHSFELRNSNKDSFMKFELNSSEIDEVCDQIETISLRLICAVCYRYTIGDFGENAEKIETKLLHLLRTLNEYVFKVKHTQHNSLPFIELLCGHFSLISENDIQTFSEFPFVNSICICPFLSFLSSVIDNILLFNSLVSLLKNSLLKFPLNRDLFISIPCWQFQLSQLFCSLPSNVQEEKNIVQSIIVLLIHHSLRLDNGWLACLELFTVSANVFSTQNDDFDFLIISDLLDSILNDSSLFLRDFVSNMTIKNNLTALFHLLVFHLFRFFTRSTLKESYVFSSISDLLEPDRVFCSLRRTHEGNWVDYSSASKLEKILSQFIRKVNRVEENKELKRSKTQVFLRNIFSLSLSKTSRVLANASTLRAYPNLKTMSEFMSYCLPFLNHTERHQSLSFSEPEAFSSLETLFMVLNFVILRELEQLIKSELKRKKSQTSTEQVEEYITAHSKALGMKGVQFLNECISTRSNGFSGERIYIEHTDRVLALVCSCLRNLKLKPDSTELIEGFCSVCILFSVSLFSNHIFIEFSQFNDTFMNLMKDIILMCYPFVSEKSLLKERSTFFPHEVDKILLFVSERYSLGDSLFFFAPDHFYTNLDFCFRRINMLRMTKTSEIESSLKEMNAFEETLKQTYYRIMKQEETNSFFRPFTSFQNSKLISALQTQQNHELFAQKKWEKDVENLFKKETKVFYRIDRNSITRFGERMRLKPINNISQYSALVKFQLSKEKLTKPNNENEQKQEQEEQEIVTEKRISQTEKLLSEVLEPQKTPITSIIVMSQRIQEAPVLSENEKEVNKEDEWIEEDQSRQPNEKELNSNAVMNEIDQFFEQTSENRRKQEKRVAENHLFETIALDKPIFKANVDLLRLFSIIPGRLFLTKSGIAFLPLQCNHSFALPSKNVSIARSSEHSFRLYPLDSITRVLAKLFAGSIRGLEIYFRNRRSLFFLFSSRYSQIKFYFHLNNLISNQLVLSTPLHNNLVSTAMALPNKTIKKHLQVQELWRNWKISNFEYLMHLNAVAGRSFSSLFSYPVFPWVLCDYSSATIDLNNHLVYRDLSKPIGALFPERRNIAIKKFQESSNAGLIPFHHGSHYSNAGIVLHYLIRVEPFTSTFLQFQGGKFDLPQRMFYSIPVYWKKIKDDPNFSKELIPEFFYFPEMFLNINNIDFGFQDEMNQNPNLHFPINGDVELPPWANGSPHTFVDINRKALESEYVSNHLHEWIDLVFGFKQHGKDAEEALNVFFYLTNPQYSNMNINDVPVDLRESFFAQILDFGQTPQNLFREPHPQRNPKPKNFCDLKEPKPIVKEMHQFNKNNTRSFQFHFPITKLISLKDNKIAIVFAPFSFTFLQLTELKSNTEAIKLFDDEKQDAFFRSSLKSTISFDDKLTSGTLLYNCSMMSDDECFFFCGNWDHRSFVRTPSVLKLFAHDDTKSKEVFIDVTSTNVLIGHNNGNVYIYDIPTKELFQMVGIDEKIPLCTYSRVVHVADSCLSCLCANTETDSLFVASNTAKWIELHSISKGIYIRTILISDVGNEHKIGFVHSVFTTNNGLLICTTTTGIVLTYSLNGALLALREMSKDTLISSCVSRSGQYLATCSVNGEISVLNSRTLVILSTYYFAQPFSCMCFSSDSNYILITNKSQITVLIW